MKDFKESIIIKLKNSLPFNLTNSQEKVLNEICVDLKSNKRMFRILQGDVGSGKTIIALLAIANIICNKYQCALMAPTEILANQHYELANKLFKKNKFKIEFLTGKTDVKKKMKYIKI